MWFDSWDSLLRVIAGGFAAYASLVVLLRVSGKRTLSKLNAFDLVVTVALGSTLATMLLVLFDRINNPVKRFLSTFGDYLAWALTFLPLLTGFLAVKHLVLPYTTMLAIHILSVELLLVALPFTKLIHVFTLFASRWYNGDINGKRGVPV